MRLPFTAEASAGATFNRAFGVSAISILAAAAMINAVVNPLGYYASDLIPPITWSDTATKLELMPKAKPPGVLVLGSSRAMALAPRTIEKLTGKLAFNAAKSHAGPEDFLAVYRLTTRELHWQPTEVLVAVDLHSLCQDIGRSAGRLSSHPISRHYDRAVAWAASIQRWRALLSWGQLRDSLRSLRHAASGTSNESPDAVFESDGWMRHPRQDRELAAGHFDPFAGVADLGAFAAIYDTRMDPDPDQLAALRELVRLAANDNARVWLFLTPNHERMQAILRRDPHYEIRRAQVVAELAALADGRRVHFIDTSDVASFGGDEVDFYDPAHLGPKNSDRLLEHLLADFADEGAIAATRRSHAVQ